MTSELNPQQQAAVDSSARDLFITAGAGSGKTRVLTESYAAWVERIGRDALDSVLTITFTDKAAGEIAERVRQRLAAAPNSVGISRDMDSAWISTIHSMCSRLLRRHALEAGVDPMFKVGSEVQLGVLRYEAFEEVAHQALDEAGLGASLIRGFGLGSLFEGVEEIAEQLRSLGITPDQVQRIEPPGDWLSESARALEELISEYGSLPTRNATIEANMASARELADALKSALESGTDMRELAVLALGIKQEKRGSQEAKDLADRGRELATEVATNAAQQAVGPFESAFLDMVAAYQSVYARMKSQRELLDFEDLQTKVIELLESHPEIAKRYAARFASVMIDEFQDTNGLQVRLIEAIAPGGFVTVGDEKQSIYRFRHADVDLFRAKEAASSEVLPLSVNYRSDSALLGFFNDLFSRSPFWPGDYLKLESGVERDEEPDARADELFGPSRVTALLVDANACGDDKHADEAIILAQHIQGLVQRGCEQKDIVILMRTMTRADTYAGALRDLGMEAFVASGGTYFDRPEVADLEMLLRVIANPLDDEALAHVLAGPVTALSADTMALLRLSAGRGHLWSAALAVDVPGTNPWDLERLRTTVSVLSWARDHVGRMGLADLIHEMCERLEYDLTLFARGFEGSRAWANVLKLARIAEEFEAENPGDPQAFIDHLRLKREHEGRESLAAFAAENVDAVRIMSVHAAKGLEFPIAVAATLGHQYSPHSSIMLGIADGRATIGMKLPCPDGAPLDTAAHRHVVELENEADLEETKRVFYVACTRAEKALILCGRSNLEKPPEEDRPIGWVRSALDSGASTDDESLRRIGDSVVRVLLPEPTVCELPGAIRPCVDEQTLARARQGLTSPIQVEAQAVERISYSGLARYRSCAYRFYATSVARLGSRAGREPEAESPTAFGSAVHAVLSLVSNGSLPSEDRIAEICRAARLGQDRWSLVREVATSYLSSDAAKRIAGCDRITREQPFAVPVGGLMLDGAIDLIAWDGSHAVVLDYKTGHTNDQFDPTDAYRAQAECYAVAASAMGADSVEVSLVELENASRVITFAFDSEEMARARRGIETSIAAILAGEFAHLDHYDPLVCAECPAMGNLCPISAPPRRAV